MISSIFSVVSLSHGQTSGAKALRGFTLDRMPRETEKVYEEVLSQ